MCGISAIVNYGTESADQLSRELALMHAQIPHRGMDGEGFVAIDAAMNVRARHSLETLDMTGARVALAFRWLIIQDDDPHAAQPMRSEDGRLWIVFNGEIYNFVELREELSRHGFAFHTGTDTEVILAAYQRWGTECLSRFDGMWAMVIVDREKRKAIVSRDRFGIKPLFRSIRGEAIRFASEIKQLVAVDRPGINESILYEYLHAHRGAFTDETYFRGIEAFPSASVLELDLTSSSRPPVTPKVWWDLGHLATAPKKASREDAKRELEHLLRESVRVHTRASVKLGTFISGGLDSTTITELVRQSSPQKHDSFTIVFDRTRYAEFDESNYVDDYVKQSGVTNHRATIDAQWIRDNLPRVSWMQDEPLMASTIFAQHRAFQLAREHGTTVVLDGQGSDEVFGGYPHHEFSVWRDHLTRGELRAFAQESKILSANYQMSIPAMYYRLARSVAGHAVRRFRLRYGRYEWLDDGYFRPFRHEAPPIERARRREALAWKSHLDQTSYEDIRYTGLPPLFLYSDRNGMAHSVEARLPYVDHRVVEFAMQLPAEMKAGSGVRKRLLRELARDHLPASITGRTDKMGFVTPESLWLRTDLHDAVLEAVDSPVMARLPFLRPEKARAFVMAYRDGKHRDFRAVWRLLALRHWIEAFQLA